MNSSGDHGRNVMVDERVASHSVDRGHLGMHLCGGQIHVYLWGGWQANLMLPFSVETCPSSCCLLACLPALPLLVYLIVCAVLLLFWHCMSCSALAF